MVCIKGFRLNNTYHFFCLRIKSKIILYILHQHPFLLFWARQTSLNSCAQQLQILPTHIPTNESVYNGCGEPF